MAMALESRRADAGIYAASGTNVTWTAGLPSNSTFLPSLVLKNATRMNFQVHIVNSGLGYTVVATDPTVASHTVLTLDQNGALTLDPNYNK
jgi:hypothetical protein